MSGLGWLIGVGLFVAFCVWIDIWRDRRFWRRKVAEQLEETRRRVNAGAPTWIGHGRNVSAAVVKRQFRDAPERRAAAPAPRMNDAGLFDGTCSHWPIGFEGGSSPEPAACSDSGSSSSDCGSSE